MSEVKKRKPRAKNIYKMWENGPDLELPIGYHFRQESQTIHKNNNSWSGDLRSFWYHQQGKEVPQ